MKRILSLFLVIAVFFSPSGCSKSESAEDKKARIISEATAYLKENYPDDEFTYVDGRSPNSAYSYYELGFTSKNYDKQEVTVFGRYTEEKNDDGLTKYNYTDDYYQYYMLEDAKKYFDKMAHQYIGDNARSDVTFLTTFESTQKIDTKKTFYENIECQKVRVLLWFECDYNLKNQKDDIESLLENLVQQKIYTLVCFQYKQNSNNSKNTEVLQYTTYNGKIEEVDS